MSDGPLQRVERGEGSTSVVKCDRLGSHDRYPIALGGTPFLLPPTGVQPLCSRVNLFPFNQLLLRLRSPPPPLGFLFFNIWSGYVSPLLRGTQGTRRLSHWALP